MSTKLGTSPTIMAKKAITYEQGKAVVCIQGTDALVEEELRDQPFCEHGPTLLFERFFKDKPAKRFFACSACRNRKDCAFFQWEDEKLTDGKALMQKEIKKKLFKSQKHKKKLKENDVWCSDCQVGIGIKKREEHKGHVTKSLIASDLMFPTSLMSPKENKKFNAQYFFDKTTCDFMLTTIKRLNYHKIICIGTPRLFELLHTSDDKDASAILLDIDKRFEQFYDEKHFQPYNMFNNFFFNKDVGFVRLTEFIGDSKPEDILIVIDPPFGGLVNVLVKTLKSLWNIGGGDMLATILVFPYFLQSKVDENLENFQMLDYKVSYENHKYSNSEGKSRGSPVRIFTNIPANRVALPKEDYRFCKLCQRYVYNANRHCKICKFCTSKDGRTYVHCEVCKICVKPGRLHCQTCGKCQPEKHICDTRRVSVGCHICGNMDHKRRDCPLKERREKTTQKRPFKDTKHKTDNKRKKTSVKM